jgi:hypothetical protein
LLQNASIKIDLASEEFDEFSLYMSSHPVTLHCDILYLSSPVGEGFQSSPIETLVEEGIATPALQAD